METHKKLFPFLLTIFFGAINDNILRIGFIMFLTFGEYSFYNVERGILVSVAGIAFILPFLLFSSLGGQIADRYEKIKVIRSLKIFEFVLIFFIVYSLYSKDIYLTFACLFMMGMQSSLLSPVKFSILKELQGEENLLVSNSLVEIYTFIAIILGTIAGTVFFDKGTIYFLLLIFSFTGLLMSFYINGPMFKNKKEAINLNFLVSTINILNFSKDKYLRKNIFFISWFWFIGSILISQLPVILESNYNDAQDITIYFYLIILFGVIFGAKFSVFYFKGNKNQKNIYKFFILNSLSLFLLGLSEFYNLIYLVCGLLFMVSFISISYVIPLYVNIQKYSLNKDRSKVIACNNIWNAIFMIISGIYIVLLYLLEFSIHDALKYLSILNIILMFYTYKLLGK